ncbi:OLC1v1006711C1 [Oldenlandia corymbosa var. corymbosa]|uniref:OLC1v1006711C1 n=1 Tax=Oldenlandia corymbosa var. corymbosa TaxID=529605 RepID=A0AAV1DIA1_OLDCO|nr:OLC1v1006711C1 [Oldenlandia corymbosa var. corymbosa]
MSNVHQILLILICEVKDDKEQKKLLVELEDLENEKIKVLLWDTHAQQVLDYLGPENKTDVVLIVQFVKCGTWNGQLSITTSKLNGKIYLDNDMDIIRDFKLRMDNVNNQHDTGKSLSLLSTMTSYGTLESFMKDAELITVDGIKNVGEACHCVTVGKIVDIIQDDDCFYVAYKKCNRKVDFDVIKSDGPIADGQFSTGQFNCPRCPTNKIVAFPRFKVQIIVVDSTGIMIVTIFDKDMFRLIGKSAYQLREKYGNVETFPPEVMSLIGKTLLFRVSVNKFNVVHNSHMYTAVRVVDDEKWLKKYKTITNPKQGTISSNDGEVLGSQPDPNMANSPLVRTSLVDDKENDPDVNKKVVNDEQYSTPEKFVAHDEEDNPQAKENEVDIQELGAPSVASTLPKRKSVMKTEKVFKRKSAV